MEAVPSFEAFARRPRRARCAGCKVERTAVTGRPRTRVREGQFDGHGLATAPSPTLPRKREREQKSRSFTRIEARIHRPVFSRPRCRPARTCFVVPARMQPIQYIEARTLERSSASGRFLGSNDARPPRARGRPLARPGRIKRNPCGFVELVSQLVEQLKKERLFAWRESR
jgi:hypothetical protein